MKPSLLVLLTLLGSLWAPACNRQRETPPDVVQAYRTLLENLDVNAPGLAVARLQEFAERNGTYPIASTVVPDIELWRARLDPAYREARDLVRDGQFDRAEAILNDLAQLADERAGRMAREFLAYEFHQMKASRLLQSGDIAAAQRVARTMRTMPLSETEQAATERLLDSAAMVATAQQMTRAATLQSAARMIQVSLYSSYADEGRYPTSLDLNSPALASMRDTGGLNPVASLDDYAATTDAFSVIVTGTDGQQRILVTHRGIEPIP